MSKELQARIAKIRKEVSGVHSLYGFNSADDRFLTGLEERRAATLSDKQEKWLADIEERVFGD